jgi:type IV pilus assembly protein PilM
MAKLTKRLPALSTLSALTGRLSLRPSRGARRSSVAPLIGLDIQPGFIAAVEARVNGSVAVHRAAGLPLAADVMREGEVLDGGALSKALRELFDRSGLDRRVRVGIANQRTVLRTLELPPVSDRKELAAAVRFQAEDEVPMPLNNAVLDFRSLGIVETPGGPRQRVVLVASQRDLIERLLAVVRDAGLRPEGVDLSAFALIRSMYRADHTDDGRVLYLNVGGLTNMAIADRTICGFTRVIGGGLEAMAIEVAERRGIPLDQARFLLSSVDITRPSSKQEGFLAFPQPALTQSHSEVDQLSATDDLTLTDGPAVLPELSGEAVPQDMTDEQHAPVLDAVESSVSVEDDLVDVRAVLENGIREIAGEVRNSLDFHRRSQDGGGVVSTIVLSGPVLEIAGFSQALESDLGLPVQAEHVRSDSDIENVSLERLAIATGLAVEETVQ